MNEISNYTRHEIERTAERLYAKIKEKKDFDKGIVLIKLLNCLKGECNHLTEEELNDKRLIERAEEIIHVTKILEKDYLEEKEMDLDEAYRLKDIKRGLERAENEKWKRHHESDERDKLVKDFEISKEDELKILQVLKTRQEKGQTIKKEYVEVLLQFIQQEKEMQARKMKRIELEER